MSKYEDLIKRLRNISKEFGQLDHVSVILLEAANAIEELQKVANKLLAKYQEEATGMIWEYSGHIDESLDFLHEEIRNLQAQIDGKTDPPKVET